MRYELEVPEGGVTIKLCVSVGIVIFYGSFSVPNPNGALYDYIKEVVAMGESTCGDVFVQPEVESTTTDRGKRQAKEEVSLRNTTSTLYISLKGVGEQNMFVLETSEGDNTAQGDVEIHCVKMPASLKKYSRKQIYSYTQLGCSNSPNNVKCSPTIAGY